MHPGAGGARNRRQLVERVKGRQVEFTRLQHDDGRFAIGRQRRCEHLWLNPPGCVHRQLFDRLGTEAKQPHGPINRAVPIGAGEDAQAWGAKEALAANIPA